MHNILSLYKYVNMYMHEGNGHDLMPSTTPWAKFGETTCSHIYWQVLSEGKGPFAFCRRNKGSSTLCQIYVRLWCCQISSPKTWFPISSCFFFLCLERWGCGTWQAARGKKPRRSQVLRARLRWGPWPRHANSSDPRVSHMQHRRWARTGNPAQWPSRTR